MTAQELKITYCDLPEVSEVFVDYLGMCTFDGQLARVEFQVTRLDMPSQPGPPTKGRRYPAARLVMTASTAAALNSQLTRFLHMAAEQGRLLAPGDRKTPTKQ